MAIEAKLEPDFMTEDPAEQRDLKKKFDSITGMLEVKGNQRIPVTVMNSRDGALYIMPRLSMLGLHDKLKIRSKNGKGSPKNILIDLCPFYLDGELEGLRFRIYYTTKGYSL